MQHYSGSGGNLYSIVSDTGNRLLIECGVTWPEVEKALLFQLKDVVGCLISHEHKDHCKCAADVQIAGIPVFATAGTIKAINLPDRKSVKLDHMAQSVVKDFTVISFSVQHDAMDPSGYLIKCDNEWLLYATDTYFIKQHFSMPFSIVAIECSYNQDVLESNMRNGATSDLYAKRLLSSHMEESVCHRYIEQFCNLNKLKEIHLLHMSKQNSRPREEVRKDFEIDFMADVHLVGIDDDIPY